MTFRETKDLFRKDQININTIVAVVGFLSMFATIIATWSSIQYRQTAVDKWEQDHEELHASIKIDSAASRAALNVRLDGIVADVAKLAGKVDNMDYRLTTTEKAVDNGDTRISRITESYGSQFTEIRGQLASLSTQVALAIDSLKRLENLDRTPKELQN